MDYIKTTIKAYTDIFEEYSKKKIGVPPTVDLLNKFTSLLPGKNILEIGFGVGAEAQWLVNNGFNYTGVDPIDKFCQSLRNKIPQGNIINQNILDANFPKESFDGIWAMAVFLHFKDQDIEIILDKCHKWLKENGILFVCLKEGEGQLIRDDNRFFNLFTKPRFISLTKDKFKLVNYSDNTANPFNVGKENWINFYLKKI